MEKQIDLKPGQTILFIGDSITDAGRTDPAYKPFGFGYVNFIANWLLAKYPEYNLNIINTGIDGNIIQDLKFRWQKDCLNHQPDILSILIGINDLWRRHNEQFSEVVWPNEYELTYKQLLLQVKEKSSSQLVLMEPFLFCDDKDNLIYRDLQDYIEIVHNLADEFDATLIPLQARVDEKIKQVTSDKWSDDMVHPFVWAHAWIAQQWLRYTNV